jgi:hypothetical protein
MVQRIIALYLQAVILLLYVQETISPTVLLPEMLMGMISAILSVMLMPAPMVAPMELQLAPLPFPQFPMAAETGMEQNLWVTR